MPGLAQGAVNVAFADALHGSLLQGAELENPKFEIRSPKQIRIPKSKIRNEGNNRFGHSDLVL
jgi:hypothetical protein